MSRVLLLRGNVKASIEDAAWLDPGKRAGYGCNGPRSQHVPIRLWMIKMLSLVALTSFSYQSQNCSLAAHSYVRDRSRTRTHVHLGGSSASGSTPPCCFSSFWKGSKQTPITTIMYRECFRFFPKIIFYLLQDGCTLVPNTGSF